jgi:predicted amidohydrolase
VRLATVHYKPQGKSPRQNCEEFAPLIAEARAEGGPRRARRDGAHRRPGQRSRDYRRADPWPFHGLFRLGLAKQHHLHIVLSLYEREAHLIYNTAVLLGPDGALIGKYRKVSLPPGEAAKGIAPGKDYPVFDTAIGKVGMMVCYDGFFPEVARELTKNGAESHRVAGVGLQSEARRRPCL